MVLPGPGKAHAQLCRLGYPSSPRPMTGLWTNHVALLK